MMPRKIPTVVGLLLLLTIVGVVILVDQALRSPTKASPSERPTNIQFTNVTDSTFTVTWVTSAPATGAVVLTGPQQRPQTFIDERDGNGKLGKYQSHSVIVRNLKPDTDFSLKILSNAQEYFDAGGKPYHVQTAPQLDGTNGSLEPAYGTALTSDNQPADGALIYLTLEGSQTLSALVKPTGSWIIPLNLIRTADMGAYISGSDRITESLLVRYQDQEATAITDTFNDSPVPTMVIGKTYDFRKQQAKATQPNQLTLQLSPTPDPSATPTLAEAVLGSQTGTPAPTAAATPTPTSTPTAKLSGQHKVTLTSPVEGAALTSRLPLIQGTGIPDKLVTVTLGITNPFSGTTKVGTDGVWRYTPTKELGQGKQSVTITTMDTQGKPVALTHAFTIFKSGTQVLGEATPSATLTPTVTATPTATPIASVTAQPIPTTATSLPTILLLVFAVALVMTGALVLL